MARKKKDETVEETQADVTETETVEETAVEAKAEEATEVVETAETETVEEKPKSTRSASAKTDEAEKSADTDGTKQKVSKRAEKVGIVASDKMTNTVTVRVDRLVKHPIYRKYIKRRKKFMAHDDLGAKIGDKVRIVETRPLSARKRWRVVEIIQKAER